MGRLASSGLVAVLGLAAATVHAVGRRADSLPSHLYLINQGVALFGDLGNPGAARSPWEARPGAAADVGASSGSVAASLPRQTRRRRPRRGGPVRQWEFLRIHTENGEDIIRGGTGVDGDLHEHELFGPLSFVPPGRDEWASGEVFSTADGGTYWVEAEAPIDVFVAGHMVGSASKLFLAQSYRKDAANATLQLVITDARVLIQNYNGESRFDHCAWAVKTEECLDTKGEISMEVHLYQGPVDLERYYMNEIYSGVVILNGTREEDLTIAMDMTIADRQLWRRRDFDFSLTEGSEAEVALAQPLRVSVDLSSIDDGAEFTLHTVVQVETTNLRGGESYVLARLRDPIETGGVSVATTGLTPTNRPVLKPFPLEPESPPSCGAGADPESGTLQFSATDYRAVEFDGRRGRIFVTRTGGSRGQISATVTTSDGTGIAGTHYAAVSRTIVFPDGDDTTRAVSVPPIDNSEAGGHVTVNVTLSAGPGCATLGTPTQAVFTILDNEFRPPPPPTFTVGGTVSGLVGSGLVLEEHEARVVVTPASDGPFAFNVPYAVAAPYDVRVSSHPTNPVQVCAVGNGTGVVAGADVTNVTVTCTTPAPPGSLDPAFGSGGKVTAGLPGGAEAMALQGDGRIVLLNGSTVARYHRDGSVDSTFGTGGQVFLRFLGASSLRALAVQGDGKIVVGGRSGRSLADGLTNFALARLNGDGSLDGGFGTGGIVYTDFHGSNDTLEDVLIQSDGRIVAAGNASVPEGLPGVFINAFAAARYLPDGAPDASFGSGGRATAIAAVTGQREVCLAFAATLQPDDALVFAGRLEYEDHRDKVDTCAMRFAANGARDMGFGEGGLVVIDYGEGAPGDDDDQADEARAVAVLPDGRIALAGHLNVTAFLVARLNADGSRDGSFGVDGALSPRFSSEIDVAHAVAVQPDGAIVVAGTARIPGPPSFTGVPDFAIARIEADGTLDPGFGSAGMLTLDFFGATDDAAAIAVQGDGGIVVAGKARNGTTTGLGLARLLP